jgi:hypothetical protein
LGSRRDPDLPNHPSPSPVARRRYIAGMNERRVWSSVAALLAMLLATVLFLFGVFVSNTFVVVPQRFEILCLAAGGVLQQSDACEVPPGAPGAFGYSHIDELEALFRARQSER